MLSEYKIKNYDFKLICYILALNFIGILVIRSATNQDMGMVRRQIIGILAGLVIMAVISLIPYQKILRYAPAVFVISCIGLILVILYGRAVGGATRWIVVPAIGQLQPSEFAKIGIIIFFSWYLDRKNKKLNRPGIVFMTLFIALIPLGLIAAEPDLSTTIVVLVCILAMIYSAGISYKWIIGAFAVCIPLGLLFFYLLQYGMIPFLHGYQAKRILAFVNKTGYTDLNLQQNNSIMAIGSGQLFGKGLNNNTLASVKGGNFLSEEQTDFIFAVIGEELGFVGAVVVIVLYAITVGECFRLAGKAADMKGRLICTGMAVLISFQSFCNIAVATGIFPNTGLTLPFISYGVSSLISLYIGIGLVLNVGLQKPDRNAEEKYFSFRKGDLQL